MSAVRVLVVDDSPTMRRLISGVLEGESDIEVVGCAEDAVQARDQIKRLSPDVVTLDVEMPHMDGLEFLEKLMRLRPTPVVMVSSHTARSTDLAMKAISIGAIDCIGKPLPGAPVLFPELADKIRGASLAGRAMAVRRAAARPSAVPTYVDDGRIVLLGSSTGGIEALSAVLDGFPADGPPVLIVQHMPENFTRSLAARLDRLCGANVREAEDGVPLQRGTVYVAPGGPTHLEVIAAEAPRCRLRPGPPVSGHRPSVDVLFHSAAKTIGDRAVGAILSGMGQDGSSGLLAMRQSGARTIGQDEATCLVYGMPRVAYAIGAVERELPIGRIRDAILSIPTRQKGQALCR